MRKPMDKREMQRLRAAGISRRGFLKAGIALGGAALIGPRAFPAWAQTTPTGCELIRLEPDTAFYPTSPFILEPFKDELPIPPPLAPSDPTTWRDDNGDPVPLPGSGPGQQDSLGGTHQIWPSQIGYPNPICYRIKLQVAEHAFTTSKVQPIDAFGGEVPNPFTGQTGPQNLPKSTIYGFNGTFPGPMINAAFGRPALVRFENHLDKNPQNLDRMDFGSPEYAFLTHLHNGHTAPESDGNPFHKPMPYMPGQWVDNLYLNYPAGGDPREMQSFLWFHDHTHGHTGANVYKGMVGLYPIYDPHNNGDETNPRGLRLPGRRTNLSNGSFKVDYDIPLALYDVRFDDGIHPHGDAHTPLTQCNQAHPEWWGRTFFQHYPSHGFVGDIFTVNGVAYPVLEVKRRKYRLRFLGASLARCYQLVFMHSTGGPVQDRGSMGQWAIPDGQQCMRVHQIANEGGLLPNTITRDSFEIWPAKRKEFIVDFTRYMDGQPTQKGDVIYLTNVLVMDDGRKPDFNKPTDPLDSLAYKVPILKIVIGDDPPEPDLSVIPSRLRTPPPLPSSFSGLRQRTFTLARGGPDVENQWTINGLPFNEHFLNVEGIRKGDAELWTIVNGGGGWTHPMHIHQEEHRVIARIDGDDAHGRGGPHPDDTGKEDVIALDPGESVTIYRKFRTFTGNYVAHCHNLAHEDHAMMFTWRINP